MDWKSNEIGVASKKLQITNLLKVETQSWKIINSKVVLF